MNHFYLNHKTACLCFTWNESGALSQVQIVEPRPSHENISKPTFEFRGKSKGLPREVLQFIEQVCDYFESGTPIQAQDWSSLDQAGWTDFQRKVYFTTTQIPFGETRSYAWIGEKIGMPLASRAVGQALRKNPIPILIPCHRVITSSGALGGFMGKSDLEHPELQLKQKLLRLEHEYRNPLFPFLTEQSPAVRKFPA